jgi:hypothetical protein
MKGEMKFNIIHDLKRVHPGLIWWLEVKQNLAVTAGKDGTVKGNFALNLVILI